MFDKKIIKEIETLHEYEYLELYASDTLPLNLKESSNRPLSEQLKVVKALGIKERRKIEKELYKEEDGWQLLHAYLLKNICPKCRCTLYIFHQSTPDWTWNELWGREGYLLYCPNCKQEIGFILTCMN